MPKISLKRLTGAGIMTALVVVGTMLIQVPTLTKGYIHIGDSMVYLSGIMLGPLAGSLAAALGSLLADVLSGYGIYAPATFVIKGLDALVVGYIYHRLITEHDPVVKKIISFSVAVILGGSIMVTGYLAYETFLYGFATAVLGVAANITQAVGGGVLAAPLLLALNKLRLYEALKEKYQ